MTTPSSPLSMVSSLQRQLQQERKTMLMHSISDVTAGYNGTVFAYGQTGSGKTFTMMVYIFDNRLDFCIFLESDQLSRPGCRH